METSLAPTISFVTGSMAICPEHNRSPPATIAWEYGPMGLGAWGDVTARWVAGMGGIIARHLRRRAGDARKHLGFPSGRLTQRKSAILTRWKSLVQSQHRPLRIPA